MKRLSYLLLASLCVTNAFAQAHNYSTDMANTVMSIWKDSLSQQGKPAKWTYDQGVVLEGMKNVWLNTGGGQYFNYIQKSMDFFLDEKGNIRTYRPEEYTLDNVTPGRALLMLYNVTGKEKYLNAVRALRRQLAAQPRAATGGFWHKKVYPEQMWLDGLYMAEPFYTEYAKTFHEDTIYNDVAHQFILMEQVSRDSRTGLLYHGYDHSRQQRWADKATGHSPNFWARAMGWYGMGLVDVLENFPADHPQRKELVQILNRYAKAVAAVQDKKTGLWWDVLDQPAKEKNYLEASASCMFVYTLAKGIRLGLLPKNMLDVASRGYSGIVHQFIRPENGLATLEGTVGVSGLGGNPYRDGSYAYYTSEKVVPNDPKGVGAFLLASSEMEMVPTLETGKGMRVTLDNYFNHELKQDVTGKEVTFHYVWDEWDNNGYSLFCHVFNKFGFHTSTLTDAPTIQNLKGSDVYIIVDPDTEKETKNPNYIQPKNIDAIYNWVKEGGILLLFGNDTGNVELHHFNQLAERFGFQFNYDSRNKVIGNQFQMGTFRVPEGHPIFSTAKSIYIKEYASQTVKGPAKAAFTDGNLVVMSVAKVGKGTVFAVGDPWFYNEYFDGRKLPASIDNYKAGEDLVRWVVSQKAK
jgi:unsaturated rhamnogalacturonyl hydrolase